jgi:hypothetical protein
LVQAKQAVERTFIDGINWQVVQLALVLPEGEYLKTEDRQLPGGAQQVCQRAAGPMTRELLQQVQACTNQNKDENNTQDNDSAVKVKQPEAKSQDVLVFDGSAIVSAEAATGAADDVHALVLANTGEATQLERKNSLEDP